MLSSCYSAVRSWCGYIYQGQVAIYHSIREINRIINTISDEDKWDNEIKKYRLVLENWEDFEIWYDDKIKSIHQIKAQDNTYENNYKEPIYEILVKIAEITPKTLDFQAYLHTSTNLGGQSWWSTSNFLKFYKGGISEFSKKVTKFSKLTKVEKVKKMKDDRSKKVTIEKIVKDELKNKHNIKTVDFIKNINIVEAKVLEVKNHINNTMKKYYVKSVFGRDVYSKIQLYKYHNNELFCIENELKSLIIEELQAYFTKKGQLDKVNEVNCERTFMYLCEEVNKSVMLKGEVKFDFLHIKSLIERNLQNPDQVYYLYEIKKSLFENLYDEYCEHECKRKGRDTCSKSSSRCNLSEVMAVVDSLTIEEFKSLLLSMNPTYKFDKIDQIHDIIGSINNEAGLIYSFYESIFMLKEMKYKSKRVYAKNKANEKSYLATCISGNERQRESIARKVSLNKHREYYDGINVMVSSGINISRIGDFAPKVGETGIKETKREKENIKKVDDVENISIMDIEKVIKEF